MKNSTDFRNHSRNQPGNLSGFQKIEEPSHESAIPAASSRTSVLVDQLRNQIRSVETVGRAANQTRVSSGCSAVDRLLPQSGYERGTLVQWLSGGGQGADYLSLMTARQACNDGGALVVLDPTGQFYPPAAAAIGINLDHLIVIKNSSSNSSSNSSNKPNKELDSDLLWSIDQALRCPAVAAVWGPVGHLGERWFRRFQLSAESSGCLGLFVQPIEQARQPSWADVQWLVTGGHSDSENVSSQQVRLQLARCRGAQTGKSVHLSINTITGNVQLARRDHEQLRRQVRQGQRDSKPKTRHELPTEYSRQTSSAG
jgi:hypothetical protein